MGPHRNTIRAYTLQAKGVLDGQSPRIVCQKRHVDTPHWLPAYRYMRRIYRQVTGLPMRGYPMWAWQVPGARLTQREKYDTTCSLDPDPALAESKVILHLQVPRSPALLTSYNLWNTLLDYVISYKKTPSEIRDWLPLCRDDVSPWDKVQVVLPYLERSWITGVEELDPALIRRFSPLPSDLLPPGESGGG